MSDRLAPYNQDALPPAPRFPRDPAAEFRARALDARIVAQFGAPRAVELATSPEAAARRATIMMGQRDEAGERLYTPAHVHQVLAAWHAAHHYPTLQAVGRG